MWCFATLDEPVETAFIKDMVIAKVTVNANQATIASIQDTRTYTRTQTSMPQGVITMWSGSIATIPHGWALCDGQNGTPNLLNRFVVAAGGTYAVGNTGGSDSVTLSTAQMPSHSHSGITGADQTVSGSGTYNSADRFMLVYTGRYANQPIISTAVGGVTAAAGSGASHENRPPYYSLAYIMKL